LWADSTQRDADGYFTGSRSVSTTGYALTSDPIQGHDLEQGWPYLSSLIGDTRVRATAQDTAIPVFVAIAPSVEAARYLAGAEYTTVTGRWSSRNDDTSRWGGRRDAGGRGNLGGAEKRIRHPDIDLAGTGRGVDGRRDERRRLARCRRPGRGGGDGTGSRMDLGRSLCRRRVPARVGRGADLVRRLLGFPPAGDDDLRTRTGPNGRGESCRLPVRPASDRRGGWLRWSDRRGFERGWERSDAGLRGRGVAARTRGDVVGRLAASDWWVVG
jgi:hypothetical protein